MTTPNPIHFVPPTDPTSLAPSHLTESGILNSVFNQIIQMTTSLQNAAAAQANRLTFLTSWQAAYTNLMSQVHTFIKGGNDAIGVDDSNGNNNTQARQDLNNLNSNLIQTMQNRQSVVSDTAKALQSNVNQSNDAVNQQSNLGTALIQEMSTLLSSIYH